MHTSEYIKIYYFPPKNVAVAIVSSATFRVSAASCTVSSGEIQGEFTHTFAILQRQTPSGWLFKFF